MTRQQDSNYAVITGVLKDKTRNANSAGIKRPVLDLEVIREVDNEVKFDSFPVIVCDTALAKPIAGYKPGDILTVQGTIRNTDDGALYLEADEISMVSRNDVGEQKPVEFALGRLELAQMSPRFNMAILIGTVDEILLNGGISSMRLRIKRQGLSHGNLNDTDYITAVGPVGLFQQKKPGEDVLCIGEIGGSLQEPAMYVSNVRTIIAS